MVGDPIDALRGRGTSRRGRRFERGTGTTLLRRPNPVSTRRRISLGCSVVPRRRRTASRWSFITSCRGGWVVATRSRTFSRCCATSTPRSIPSETLAVVDELKFEEWPGIDAIDDVEALVGLRFLGISECSDVASMAQLARWRSSRRSTRGVRRGSSTATYPR
jgi:hypothetical protein